MGGILTKNKLNIINFVVVLAVICSWFFAFQSVKAVRGTTDVDASAVTTSNPEAAATQQSASATSTPATPADESTPSVPMTSAGGSNEPVTTGQITNGASGSTSCGMSETALGVPIPIYEKGGGFSLKYCATNMADYMMTIYNFLVVIAVISAILMVIYGGYMYMLSAGNAQKVVAAKEIILGAIVGLLLLLAAGVIVSTIGVNK